MPTHGGLETLLPSAAISSCRPSGQSDSAAHPHPGSPLARAGRSARAVVSGPRNRVEAEGREQAGSVWARHAVDSEWPDSRQSEIALQGGSGASAMSVGMFGFQAG